MRASEETRWHNGALWKIVVQALDKINLIENLFLHLKSIKCPMIFLGLVLTFFFVICFNRVHEGSFARVLIADNDTFKFGLKFERGFWFSASNGERWIVV